MRSLARPEDAAEILRRLQALKPDSLRRWGRMSAHQMVCHLCDSFRVLTEQMRVSEATSPFQRTVVKWVALYAPLPWPPGIRTRPEIDQCLGAGTPPADFAADVARLRAQLELAASPSSRFDGRRHPVFGPMSHGDWLRWGYLHTDHHFRQFGA